MKAVAGTTVNDLIEELTAICSNAKGDAQVPKVKDCLSRFLEGNLELPPQYLQPAKDHYARHLLYRQPNGGFTIVVMVWSPGQATPVHDHAGTWCVEGVYQGSMKVERFHLRPLANDGERSRTTDQNIVQMTAGEILFPGKGQTGALIPPVEHHRMGNESRNVAVTIHVYGGELSKCKVFEPLGNERYLAKDKTLTYTTERPVVVA